MDQWNKIKNNLHIDDQLIFDKGQSILNKEKTVFSINDFGKTGYPHEIERNWTSNLHYS